MNTQKTLEFDYDQPTKALSDQVVCLGITFENDEERRKYFNEKLREKLQDPEFRKIEGFPIGSDEDILALSDPPYYTACPNPWISEFIKEWEAQKPEKSADNKYHREPFASDVSEGKNDPIYNAHSYHTKVPHKAIMRYILHYTEPGDIVFDGFCGTGMTGVAAQMCGDRKTVESLGYQVKPDGTIMQQETDEDGKTRWVPFSKLGVRRSVLNDLSPAATFIASSLNGSIKAGQLDKSLEQIIHDVQKDYGWMYKTAHSDGGNYGEIAYTIWSDVLICPSCQEDLVFWDVAVDKKLGEVKGNFNCPKCNSILKKADCPKKMESSYDQILGSSLDRIKQIPVLIEYYVGKRKYTKIPDALDFERLRRIEEFQMIDWIPTVEMIKGERFFKDAFKLVGFSHVHHFFKKSSLISISALRTEFFHYESCAGIFLLNSITGRLVSNIVGYQLGKRGNVPMSGTLYIPSLIAEANPFRALKSKLISLISVLNQNYPFSVTTSSSSRLYETPDNSIDYIFTDPPFGNNLSYSELNLLNEAWLNILTNHEPEAIVDKGRQKEVYNYKSLLGSCFKEFYRILKPNAWITVEFHNSKNSIWNVIQQCLGEVGFVIGDVRTLDKKGETYKQSQQKLVKADLIISAYKPDISLVNSFSLLACTEEGAWAFIRNHLSQLPVFVKNDKSFETILERQFFMLFDRMVAFHVQRGVAVPLSANEFRLGLQQKFPERDEMFFLPDQVTEYDRRRLKVSQVVQCSLFISDEASAIKWLRHTLKLKPLTFQELHPQFLKEIGGWSKNEITLELSTILEQNFFCYDGKGLVPEQIHSYLSTNWKDMRNLLKDDPNLVDKARDRWYVPDPNKAGDLEKLREKALLKEFEQYRQAKRNLKIFRLEAIRAGFKKAWQERDYATILSIAEKIPNNVLEEDPKLLMWYDQAVTRMGGE